MHPNQTPDGADDQTSPNWSEIRETSLRLEEERKHATNVPSNADEAWQWFLTLFSDRHDENRETDDGASRQAA